MCQECFGVNLLNSRSNLFSAYDVSDDFGISNSNIVEIIEMIIVDTSNPKYIGMFFNVGKEKSWVKIVGTAYSKFTNWILLLTSNKTNGKRITPKITNSK